MSYYLSVQQSDPQKLWILDNPDTFVDSSGNGGVAAKGAANSTIATSAALVSGAANSLLLRSGAKIKFTTELFAKGEEFRTFGLEAWVVPIRRNSADWVEQQVLGHTGYLDGITIQGTIVRFSTRYVTADPAVCSYDLKTLQKAHIVGVHTQNSNNLYVNGVLVDTVTITDAQQRDKFVYSDGFLFSGEVSNTQEIAVNGVGLYQNINADAVKNNYNAGSVTLDQDTTAITNGGQPLPMCKTFGSEFSTITWEDDDDFATGMSVDVASSENALYATEESGYWTNVFPLSSAPGPIYGVMVEWVGSVDVSASLDGTNWTALTNGLLCPLITNNFDGTNKNLHIRVFVGDGEYLESITVHGYATGAITSIYNRVITAAYPSVIRDDYEPFLYRDDNGIRLVNTDLTIGPDTSDDPISTQTVEFWIKANAAWTITTTGTQYVNGVASTAKPIGEWCLVHIVRSSASSDPIVLNADGIVGQMVIYLTGLSAAQVLRVYRCYTGIPIASVSDSGVTVTEPATPANIYAHAWSEVGLS